MSGVSTDCVFCAILAGDGERSLVTEDSRTPAFLDVRPVTAGHTLVVPRRHADSLAGLEVV